MTDPIADYLTRLRNAIMAGHRVVDELTHVAFGTSRDHATVVEAHPRRIAGKFLKLLEL